MIKIGTKLKSERSGKVIEIVGMESGAKRVKLDDGSVKLLSDATIARWYVEVAERPVKVENTAPIKFTLEGKKKNKNVEELYASFLSFCKAYKIVLAPKKIYNGAYKNGSGLFRFFILNRKLRFEIRGGLLLDNERAMAVKMPDHFRRSYNYIFMVKDKIQLKRFFEVVKRVIKENK